jgi:putative FmdB family regulatory protein
MPTYEYRCRACGHGFDIVQSFKDESLTICPACGGELRKVYGAPAISFKGSGFYATDSRRKAGSEGQNDSRKDAKKPDGSQAGSEGSKDPKESKNSKDPKAGGSSSSGGDAGGSGSSAPTKGDPSASSSKRQNERSKGS